MLDFVITFGANSIFQFVDNSDYSALVNTNTDLEITYPKIATSTLINIDLYDENIAAAGDDLDIDINDFATLSTIVDGTYKFRLVSLNVEAEEAEKIIYVNQWYTIKSKRRLLMEAIIDDECNDKQCKIAQINAGIKSADEFAENGDWDKAQEIVSWLLAEVQKDTFLV